MTPEETTAMRDLSTARIRRNYWLGTSARGRLCTDPRAIPLHNLH
jgi:hypothetical protein